MLENFQGDSWGSIPPLRMPSLLPHELCHGWTSSRWLPAVIEFQLSYSRSWKMMLWKVLHSICNVQYAICTQYAICRLPALNGHRYWSVCESNYNKMWPGVRSTLCISARTSWSFPPSHSRPWLDSSTRMPSNSYTSKVSSQPQLLLLTILSCRLAHHRLHQGPQWLSVPHTPSTQFLSFKSCLQMGMTLTFNFLATTRIQILGHLNDSILLTYLHLFILSLSNPLWIST